MLRRALTAAAFAAVAMGVAGGASGEMQQRSIPGGGVDQQQAGVPGTGSPRVAGVDLASGHADPAWLIRPSAVVIAHGSVGSRPLPDTSQSVIMDASMGPAPLVMTKSQVVGNEVQAFVMSQVPEGSAVEKWDSTQRKWIVVSTPPETTSPRELLGLLDKRLVKPGDALRWVPPASAPVAQRAFSMSDWAKAGMPVPTTVRAWRD
jgi:hypothetical protein